MKLNAKQAYAQRIDAVIDYIDGHLDDALPLAVLSDVAHFSTFHFHRQFTAYTGISVARLVRLKRLKRASLALAFSPDVRIIDIALQACFENAESFSRAFKKVHGQTPSEFRLKPQWAHWTVVHQSFANKGRHTMQVDLIEFPETHVAAVEHLGSPDQLFASVAKLTSWRKANRLTPETSNTYGLAYSDPAQTPDHDFRFDCCAAVTAAVAENDQGLVSKVIPGGRCARIRHLGSTDNVGETIQYLMGDWLPQSGETLRDYPLIFQYVKLESQVPTNQMITDVHLLLK